MYKGQYLKQIDGYWFGEGDGAAKLEHEIGRAMNDIKKLIAANISLTAALMAERESFKTLVKRLDRWEADWNELAVENERLRDKFAVAQNSLLIKYFDDKET